MVSTNYESVNSTVNKCQNNTTQEKIQINVKVNIAHLIVNTIDKYQLF